MKVNNYLHKILSPIGLYWLYFFSFIIIFTFFVPPFQKPDEQMHFLKAMALASGQIQCRKENGISYFILPKSIAGFPDQMQMNSILQRPQVKFPIGVLTQKYPFRGEGAERMIFPYCSFPSVAYIPYALGAWAVAPLNNVLITFYAMRIISAALFIAAVIAGFNIIPKRYRMLLLFFSGIPMLIHQATAISYDASSFALGIVLFSLSCLFLDKKKISIREFFVFLLLTLLFSVVKYAYYFVYLFPLLLLPKLPVKKMYTIILAGIFVAAGIVCYFLFADNALAARSFIFNTQTASQIFMMTHYPWEFLRVSGTSAIAGSGQMIQEMIGRFGWQDYLLPDIIVYLYVAIFGIVLFKTIESDRKVLSPIALFLLWSVIGANFFLMYACFYIIIQTPIAYFDVIGMQGRYYLMFVPFIAYGISQFAQYVRHSRVMRSVTVGMVGAVIVFSTLWVIYHRYFYYGQSFSNPNALDERIKKGEIDVASLVEIPVTEPMRIRSRYPIAGNKIGGFQLLMSNEREVTTPYQYVLKDASCTQTLKTGILDRIKGPKAAHLLGVGDVVYTQYVTVTRMSETSLCLELIPLMPEGGKPIVLMGETPGEPLVEYLSIIQ